MNNNPLLFINSVSVINEANYNQKYNLTLKENYLVILKNCSIISGTLKKIDSDSITIINNNISYTISLLNVNNILLLNQSVV